MSSYWFEFFPTPSPVIEQMAGDLDIVGKNCYDPQGGTGHIVRYMQEHGAGAVYATELDQDFRRLLTTYCTVIGEDFLKVTADQISHIDLILMNPPFSNASEHIVHAFNIAPPGCKIRALCNWETIKNPCYKSREQLKEIVDAYGSAQNIGKAFNDAERKTDVEIGLLRIDKPAQTKNEWEGFFFEDEQEEKTAAGLMPYNVVRDLVNRYVEAVKIYDEQLQTAARLNDMTSGFYGGGFGLQVTRAAMPIARNQFKNDLQKSGWQYIFSKLNLDKHVTRQLKADINDFVERQQHIPFTMRNVYRMLEIVIGTTGSRMDKAILEVFDKVTSYHDDNKQGLPGWKTNSHYLLTRRFIMPDIAHYDGRLRSKWNTENSELVEDLVKALCYITGEDYGEKETLHKWLEGAYTLIRNGEPVRGKDGKILRWSAEYQVRDSMEKYTNGGDIAFRDIKRGEWFEWEFFRIRVYKKGTVHFEFIDEKVWAQFNQRVAKLKGYPLAEKKDFTAYQNRQHGRKTEKKKRGCAPVKPVILGTFQYKKAG